MVGFNVAVAGGALAVLALWRNIPFAVGADDAASASEDADSKVHVLTTGDFDRFLKENKKALVKFYAPWCGHCKRLAPEYEKAAQLLADSHPDIVLAKVDATVEEELARTHEIRGFPTLKFFRDGVAEEYRGGRSSEGIVEWLLKMTGPAVTLVGSNTDAEKETESSRVVFLGTFRSTDEQGFKDFETVASAKRHQGKFLAIVNDSVEIDGRVTVLRSGESVPTEVVLSSEKRSPEDAEKEDSAKPNGVAALEKLVAAETLPYFGPIDSENYADYFASEKDLVWFPAEEEDFKAHAPEIRKAASQFRDNHAFVWLDTSKFSDHATQSLGVSTFPALVYTAKDGRYVFSGNTFTAEAVTSFLRDVLGGKVEKSLMSEPIPETNDEPVKVVVGKTFSDLVLQKDKDVLLEVYAPWCGHCKKFEPIYSEFAERMASNDGLLVAKMDGTANEVPVAKFEWRGFPTIFFVPAGASEPISFDGARTLDGLTEFVKEHATKPFIAELSDGVKDEL